MKYRRFPRRATLSVMAAALALFVAFGPAGHVSAQVPPPAPPVPNGTPAPLQGVPSATPLPSGVPIPSSSPTVTPSPTRAPRGRRRAAPSPSPSTSAAPSPSATPTSPAFATLDGTWEFQLQYIDRTEYSYLIVHQVGSSEVSGLWRVSGKDYPFQGSYDGRLIRLVVKRPTAGDVTMSGYVEGASDMVGELAIAGAKGDPTPFTAEHRGSSRGSIFKKNP